MNTLETDAEIMADGSLKLPAPLPAWLTPGHAHVLLTVTSVTKPGKRRKLSATPEMVERRKQALRDLRAMGGLKQVIPDPAVWQTELREDVQLPGRE